MLMFFLFCLENCSSKNKIHIKSGFNCKTFCELPFIGQNYLLLPFASKALCRYFYALIGWHNTCLSWASMYFLRAGSSSFSSFCLSQNRAEQYVIGTNKYLLIEQKNPCPIPLVTYTYCIEGLQKVYSNKTILVLIIQLIYFQTYQ